MEESNFFAGDFSGAGECYFGHQKPTDFMYNNSNNQFIIDDLLVDFPNNDDVVLNDAFFDNVNGNSTDSSTVTAVDSCNSSVSGSEAPFSGNVSSRSRFSESQFSGVEICLPYDDLAELEWLSDFTQDSFSFSTDEFQSRDLKFISAAVNGTPATDTSSSHTTTTTPEFRSKPKPKPVATTTTRSNSQIFQTEVFIPGKSRSKKSRIAPCDWTSRILHLKLSSSSSSKTGIKPHKPTSFNRREVLEPSDDIKRRKATSFKQRRGEVLEPSSDDIKRQKAASFKQRRRENVLGPSSTTTVTIRCLHCGSDTTPQWRSGPMGPKTLCNACGVRYKSGRLVPEYRPAASPTYVSAKHSNSHRKVMEIRRQKELRNVNHHELVNRSSGLDGSDGGGDGCLIDRQSGPGFYEGVWN